MHYNQIMRSMSHCCSWHTHTKNASFDYLLWWSLILVVVPYFLYLFFADSIASIPYLHTFAYRSFYLFNEMLWGMLLGIFFVGLLDEIPQNYVLKVLGKGGTWNGIVRATLAGTLLDLCSHGILLVGMKLYKQWASLGQVMAFLIASPWNSLSLTFILWALVWFWWMFAFLVLSMVIALLSGAIFDVLVRRSILPHNPNTLDPKDLPHQTFTWSFLKKENLYPTRIWGILKNGLMGSRMVLRWLFFGMVIATLMRTFIPPETFQTLFGPTLAGLGLTLVAATIIEVCSEWSTPIAAGILNQAWAPGNSFAFMMAGISTDYTEILWIREATKSWKIALFLPLITLPQVIILALILNTF